MLRFWPMLARASRVWLGALFTFACSDGGKSNSSTATETGSPVGRAVESWGDIRCFNESESHVCYSEQPDGSFVVVYPGCSLQSAGESPNTKTLGDQPYEILCGEGRTTLEGWDEIMCFEPGDHFCFARQGDWATVIDVDCGTYDDYIYRGDPDFPACLVDTAWEAIRCTRPHFTWEDPWCEAKIGSYFTHVECEIPYGPQAEVDPSIVECRTFNEP